MKIALLALPWLLTTTVAHSQCLQDKWISPTPTFDGFFGSDLDVEGDLLAIGSSYADGAAANSGTVFLYRRSGNGWDLETQLNASDGATIDYFGNALLVDGGRVAVSSESKRAVYIFEEQPAGWVEVAKVEPPEFVQVFGRSFDLDGGTLAVGAPADEQIAQGSGSVRIFEEQPNGWAQVQTLVASDAALGDQFGTAVKLDGDRLFVGALYGDGVVPDSGAVYVFERQGGTWIEAGKIFANDGMDSDYFGAALDAEGDQLLVGALREDGFCPQFFSCNSGAAYVFDFDGATWSQAERLDSTNPRTGAQFGAFVALRDGVALIGANSAGDYQEGRVFAFEETPLGWVPAAEIAPLGATDFGQFGRPVFDGDDGFLVSSERDNEVLHESGSVYLYAWDSGSCPSLVGAPTTLSLNDGGNQVLALDAGLNHGGELFVMLGSLSGTSPGVVLDGFTLPLQVDAYFATTLSGAAPFSGSPGFLDGLGRAEVSIDVPAGTQPPLLGLTAHHAFLTLDLAGAFPVVSFTSEAESLQLIP